MNYKNKNSLKLKIINTANNSENKITNAWTVKLNETRK